MAECCGDAPPKSAARARAWAVAKVCAAAVTITGLVASVAVNLVSARAASTDAMTRREVSAEISRQTIEIDEKVRESLATVKAMQATLTAAINEIKEVNKRTELANLDITALRVVTADLVQSRDMMRTRMEALTQSMQRDIQEILKSVARIEGRMDVNKNKARDEEHAKGP